MAADVGRGLEVSFRSFRLWFAICLFRSVLASVPCILAAGTVIRALLVSLTSPSFPTDLIVIADILAVERVWLGMLSVLLASCFTQPCIGNIRYRRSFVRDPCVIPFLVLSGCINVQAINTQALHLVSDLCLYSQVRRECDTILQTCLIRASSASHRFSSSYALAC